jgi:hypothetical protein
VVACAGFRLVVADLIALAQVSRISDVDGVRGGLRQLVGEDRGEAAGANRPVDQPRVDVADVQAIGGPVDAGVAAAWPGIPRVVEDEVERRVAAGWDQARVGGDFPIDVTDQV